ncbi:MAG TPA: hypothetical protein VHK63_04370 [Candidatus Limnocylindria bacterium]|nr:hypothetical protein [Candidatus Limnocylindria bacterium]
MLRRIVPAVAAVALTLAACSSGPPPIADPKEIVLQGLQATSELGSAHVLLVVDGTVSIPDMGGEMSLSGTRLEGGFDLENRQGRLEFTIPPIMGLTGEVIQIGGDTYTRTSLTGELWSKSTVSEDVAARAMDPAAQLDEVRAFLEREGVELEKLDDTDCGDRTCYAVRLTVPAGELTGAAGGAGLNVDQIAGETLVVDVFFDREELWFAGAETTLSAESLGEVTLTLTLSEFNEPVQVEAPPADEVTEEAPRLPF